MSVIDLDSYRIIIEFDLKGKSKLTVDPPNKLNLETIANVLSVHQRLTERQIAVNTVLNLVTQASQLNHLPSLEEIKKSKQ